MAVNMFRKFSTFKLPKLPFGESELEPIYDKNTISYHWGKHHKTYVDRLNAALGETKVSLLEVVKERAQHSLPLRNNGGGHYNHCLFWLSIGKGAKQPGAKLLAHIESQWGSLDNFKAEFSQAAINTFGSGWAWLSVTPEGRLLISSSPNQDSPLMKGIYKANAIPFFTLDVWEHAYYLQYQNRRPDFVNEFWKIVNWTKVDEMYLNYALKQHAVPADQLLG